MSIIHNIIDRLHVSATNTDVVRAVRKAMKPKTRRYATKSAREFRKHLYRMAIKRHAANRKLYHRVMTGDFR